MAAAAMRSFDTLRSFERLKEAGVSEIQARVFVKMLAESIDASIENLTTKPDLQATQSVLQLEAQAVKTELKLEIQELRTELKADIQALHLNFENRMSKLEANMYLMQKLFFGGIMAILLGMVVLFLHQG